MKTTAPQADREMRLAKAPELRISESQGKRSTIEGYAAVFDSLSEEMFGFRERIRAGAFTRTLRENADVRALIDHDSSKILGRSKAKTLSLREDETGLHVRIVPPDTQVAHDVLESIGRGDVDQMSFAFRTVTDEWHKEDGEEIRELIDVDLFDVSIVTFPAYPDTKVAVRSLAEYRKCCDKKEPQSLGEEIVGGKFTIRDACYHRRNAEMQAVANMGRAASAADGEIPLDKG